MILGMDISTSATGVSILDKNNELIHCSAWRTDKKNLSFYQKLDIIRDNLCYIKSQYPIEKIYVEEPLNMFAAGRSSAQVISKIQRFNGIVCWILRDLFDIDPQYINASTARKLCGVSIKRGQNTKKVILKFIDENEKSFSVKYTQRGNPVKGSYDKADSVIIARAGYFLLEKEKNRSNIIKRTK